MTPPAATGWSTSKEVGQSVSEQFAHEGAPNGESTETDVVDPTVETDEVSASDVESGAGDTAAEADAAEGADILGEPTEDGELAEDGEAPAAEASADPVADFKRELRMKEGDWYVIHSYAGYENRVKANLETRIQTLNMEDFIFEIEVPMEEVTEIKNGQKKQVRRVRMPGYVLVRMDLTDESWGAVRHTPGVTGFVGNARRARRRLRDRRVRHRHGGAVRDPSRHDLRDQHRHAEAQGARLDLRPGDPGRALLRPGRQDLTKVVGPRAADRPRTCNRVIAHPEPLASAQQHRR
jgi:transcription antitermination factor NusG